MKRIFFTNRMALEILAGNKTATTRDHRKEPGIYEACTGSWHDPKTVNKFAVLEILTVEELGSFTEATGHWSSEGFKDRADMIDFCQAALPQYLSASPLYYHAFKVI